MVGTAQVIVTRVGGPGYSRPTSIDEHVIHPVVGDVLLLRMSY